MFRSFPKRDGHSSLFSRSGHSIRHWRGMDILTLLLVGAGLLGFALCYRCINWFEKI